MRIELMKALVTTMTIEELLTLSSVVQIELQARPNQTEPTQAEIELYNQKTEPGAWPSPRIEAVKMMRARTGMRLGDVKQALDKATGRNIIPY